MSWSKSYEQVINLSAKSGSPLRRSPNDNAQMDAIYWASRDRFNFRLRFVAESGPATAPLEVQELSPGDQILVAGNYYKTPSPDPCLFSADGFVKKADDLGAYYESVLSLDTDEGNSMIDGLAASESLQCFFDFIILNQANTERYRFQAKVFISKPVYIGQGSPTPSNPQYPTPGALVEMFATESQARLDGDHENAIAIDSKADLGPDGKLLPSQLPPLAISEFLGTVATQAAMLALSGERGDWCVRSDTSQSYILAADDPTQLASWQLIVTPGAPVLSVAGRTGAVVLAKADVGLSNVDNTSDADKPVSTAQAGAIALKLDITSKASNADAQTGTDTGKYLVSSVLASWWTQVKTQVLTLTNSLTVGGNVILNGSGNRAPNTPIPLPDDSYLVTKAALRSELPTTIVFSAPIVEMTANSSAANDFGARIYRLAWSSGPNTFYTRELYAISNSDNVMFSEQQVASTLIVNLKAWAPAVNNSYYKLRFAWGYDITQANLPINAALAWVEFSRSAPDSQVVQMVFGYRSADGIDHVSAPVDASGGEGFYLSEVRYPVYRFTVVPDTVNPNKGILNVQVESGYSRFKKNFSFPYENIKSGVSLSGFAIEQVADHPPEGGLHSGLSILNVQWRPYAAKLV